MSDYDPPRQTRPRVTRDPLEVELVFNVRPCGTCEFFWPSDPGDQPYGPFPAFDFDANAPQGKEPSGYPESYQWVDGKTRTPSFPNGEVMDGCRKAPIMTIGINPNLTAFSPGVTGTEWAYPDFTSDDGTDEWAKYAYYYRYRNVYQERFSLDFVKKYLLTAGQVVARKSGVFVSATRDSSAPSYDIVVRYDGESKDTKIALVRKLDEPRYVLLFNREPPGNRFEKGDVIAAKLDVPAGEDVAVYQQLQAYYMQFVPTLQAFEKSLERRGYNASLRIGEDVGQLDMVACASPHWKPSFLGGTATTENHVIENCVSINAWAMKQLVQTGPAVLFLVGESSYSMFRQTFGGLITRNPPLSSRPSDGAFTLFRETIDSDHPAIFEFSTTIDGRPYSISTRIVVTPHFSYDTNFYPQFRLSPKWLQKFRSQYSDCAKFLDSDKRVDFQRADWGYDAWLLTKDADKVVATLKSKFPDAYEELEEDYYDPHAQMATVLDDLFAQGKLGWQKGTGGKPGYLARTEGSCQFCVNKHWTFPLGCPYGKPDETPPPPGFLTRVAEQVVKEGRPT